MHLLFYLGHPAQYHFFKNISYHLKSNNHIVKYVIKSKDVLEQLLINDNEDFINILPKGRKATKSSIFIGLIKRDYRLYKIVKKEKPDLMVGSDPAITHIGKLFRIPVLTVLEDDYDVIKNLARLTFPFTCKIIAPSQCNCGKWEHKKVSYEGYMKLSYLHPKYFIPKSNNLKKYFLIRLSSLDAYHDFGINGFDKSLLEELIKELLKYGDVKLLNEGKVDKELSKYLLNINPNEIHHYLYNSEMLISDSQSMSMEAAVLGVPSIRYSDFVGRISVLEELEHKYGLTFGIKTSEPEKLIQKVKELLNTPNLEEEWQKRRQKMLKDKIDVTAFMVWFIENYPESFRIMKESPDYQYRFR